MSQSFYIATTNTVFECYPCRSNSKLQQSLGSLIFVSFSIQVDLVEIFPLKYSSNGKQATCKFGIYCLLE